MSKTGTWVRGIIMLAFLIAIPFVGVFYGGLPQEAKMAVDRAGEILADMTESERKLLTKLSAATPSAPSTAQPPLAEDPVALSNPLVEATPLRRVSASVADSPAVPLNPVATVQAAPLPPEAIAGGQQFVESTPVAPPPVSIKNSAQHRVDDQMQQVAARLQQYGAVEYALEQRGNEQLFYRFTCRVPWGQSANSTRLFQASHLEPMQAIQDVIRQVADWKVGRPNKALR